MDTNKTIKQRVVELEERITKLEAFFSPNSVNPLTMKTKKISAKEFLMTKKLKTETQKVLALGYYLEHMGSTESFNTADLEAIFRSVRERLPKNMNDAVNKNIARGFLMDAAEKKDNKKAWVLTATGEKFVEDNFSNK
jgi:hypothetical protein